MSALLPAAELLVRGTLDVRHRHWDESQSFRPAREAVQEARRTATAEFRCTRKSCRVCEAMKCS